METTRLLIKDIKSNKRNPRRISPAQEEKLVNSVLLLPEMLEARPLVINEENVVLGGNQRLKALRRISKMTATEIQARLFELKEYRKKAPHRKAALLKRWTAWLEEPLVTVGIEGTWSEDEEREFMVKDNVSFGEWDEEIFKMPVWDDVDFSAWGLDFDGDNKPEKKETAPEEDSEDYEDSYDEDENEEYGEDEDIADYDDVDIDDAPSFGVQMYKDVLYDYDNDFEIPNLMLNRQAGKLELPLGGWGSVSRLRADITTYHFYVDDYRFEALFKDPVKLINSRCKAIVEPNCSLHDQTPIAFGLNQIYKKRYLARYCQECGIDVYVDLNVAEKFRSFNKMGVPKGYNAFATRGLEGWLTSLENDLKDAQEISGLEVPNLIVYGGGKEVQSFCQAHSLLYVTDFINAKKL